MGSPILDSHNRFHLCLLPGDLLSKAESAFLQSFKQVQQKQTSNNAHSTVWQGFKRNDRLRMNCKADPT
ncbi:MAG: hypothetical protein CMJ77_06185 [Planctomycetaceae bacterium]|nr:hypothetical protein [Planctomycetaceae bacterium]